MESQIPVNQIIRDLLKDNKTKTQVKYFDKAE